MRMIFLSLLLTNLGYLAWHAWIVPTPGPSAPALRSSAPLVLAREAPAALPVEAASIQPEGARCVSVGPFVDLTEAVKAGTSLRANGYAPRQRALEGAVWAGYWVALEAVPSFKEADSIVTRLRKAGIADSYIMPGGSGAGVTISLGLFTERRRALTRMDEVRALGLQPTINARQRSGTVYWIDLDIEGGVAQLDLARFQGDAGRILRLAVKDCGAVAEPDSAPIGPAENQPG
jgi:hypothetical protein